VDLVLRGRKVSAEDIELIRSLIFRAGQRGRSFLSCELCRLWNWTQPSGKLKDAACRALLLQLEDKGLICLPVRLRGTRRGVPQSRPPSQPSLFDAAPIAPVAPADLTAIEWQLADTGRAAALFKELLAAHHYLGYRRAVGHRLHYIAYAGETPVACFAWAAAAQKVASRDQLIGWNAAQRFKNLHLVVNNTRFLILPRVPHLASRLLAANMRRLAQDWQDRFGYAPALLETFVDTTRFKGTCYKAANWIAVGLTQGRGKYDRHTRRAASVKAVFLYPLRKDFRQVLTHD
jgi:hypothetical protein